MHGLSLERSIGPWVWKAADFVENSSWIRQLTEGELNEIWHATHSLMAQQTDPKGLTPCDFPLPTLISTMEYIRGELSTGRGFILIRGLNVKDYELDVLKVLYWGLGAHLGRIVSQNAEGDLLGYVTDRSDATTMSGEEHRAQGHRGPAPMLPHSDSTDTVGLLCVRPAKKGGRTSVCSSMAIHNELLEKEPECLARLYEGFYFDMTGKGKGSENISNHRIPVFRQHRGKLSCYFNKSRIELGMRNAGIPLDDLQQAAINRLTELAVNSDLPFRFDLLAGDILLLNSHLTLHSREEYEDWPESDRKRFLLRLWLSLSDAQPVLAQSPKNVE